MTDVSSLAGQVVCADALDFLRSLPDNAVDWVITDPPYGTNCGTLVGRPDRDRMLCGNRIATGRNYESQIWDTERPSSEHLSEVVRVSRNQIIFGGNFFADLLPPTRCWLCWDKGRRNDFADCELAWTSLDEPARVINYHYDGCMTAMPNRELPRVHPTQKPVPVMEWIINRFTQPGQLILDPFCGSGTTLTAAERLGRRWIGCDIDPHWCEVSRKRTAQKGLDLA